MKENYPAAGNELPEPIVGDDPEAQKVGVQEEISLNDLVHDNELKKMLDKAFQRGSAEDLMRLLDNGMDVNQLDFMDRTPLMLCATRKQEEYTNAMEILLERGADPNAVMMFQNRIPFTALDAARQTKNPAAAALLEGLEDADGIRIAKTGREVAAEEAEKAQAEQELEDLKV